VAGGRGRRAERIAPCAPLAASIGMEKTARKAASDRIFPLFPHATPGDWTLAMNTIAWVSILSDHHI